MRTSVCAAVRQAGRRVFCCAREQTENVPGTGIANRQGYLLRKLHASFPERSQICLLYTSRYSLLEKTGELKKRLDLYSEETVRRLDSAARGQEEAVRKEQSERNAFWERFEKKRAEEQKKLRSGMRARCV